MSDRFKELPERQQRIEMMRRNGEDFRDADGNWLIDLGDDASSSLVRAVWDDDPDEPQSCTISFAEAWPEGPAA